MTSDEVLDLDRVPEPMQALAPRLDDADPDGFQGTIHYSKGQLFLEYLEQAFGRSAFDAFLARYFREFAFDTITTEGFLDFLDQELLSQEGAPVTREQAEQWTYGPGLPDDAPVPSSANLDTAAQLAAEWAAGETELADFSVAGWSPQARIHFINSLPANVPVIFETTVLLAAFGAVFGMLMLNALPMLYNPLFNFMSTVWLLLSRKK